MIISVSMNPSVDKILNIPEFKAGFLNRIQSTSVTAGGKGINVANVLAAFTKDVVLTGFVGDSNNEIIDECTSNLADLGICVDFVKIHGRTRTNIKIIEDSSRLTEINEPGFQVTPEDINLLNGKLLSYAKPGNIFILTGSLPNGLDSNYYGELIKTLKEKGAKVFVDTDGEPLKKAIPFAPNMIKPNQDEILALFSEKNVSEKSLINMGKKLCSDGIETVIISRGSLGSLFITQGKVLKCDALPMEIRSSVGAGDSMIAAYAYAESMEIPFEEGIKLSVAAASHTVTLGTPYLTDKTEVEKLIEKVVLKTLE